MDRSTVKIDHYPTRRGMCVQLGVGGSRAQLTILEAEDVVAEMQEKIEAARAERDGKVVAHV